MIRAVSVTDVETATAGVLERLAALPDDVAAEPSRLPGWTVGHVLTHVARNADAFVRVAADRRAGRDGVMYPHGEAGRGADIDAGSTRPLSAIAADVEAAGAAFADAWRSPVPDGPCVSWVGLPTFPAAEIPLRRLREVEVHATDTGLDAFGHRAWTDAYVEADLPVQWAQVHRRTDDAGAVHPDAHDPRDLLAWLLDRHTAPGLPPLLEWGAPATWKPA